MNLRDRKNDIKHYVKYLALKMDFKDITEDDVPHNDFEMYDDLYMETWDLRYVNTFNSRFAMRLLSHMIGEMERNITTGCDSEGEKAELNWWCRIEQTNGDYKIFKAGNIEGAIFKVAFYLTDYDTNKRGVIS